MPALVRSARPAATQVVARRQRAAVLAGFAAQGLGYAAVVTALPSFQVRWSIDGTVVALAILGVCVTAAVGSIVANSVALHCGSRVSLAIALLVQAVTILAIVVAPSLTLFLISIVAYGIGLGMMDASQNMQAVLLERSLGRPLMGKFYASYTAASIVGALCISAFLASSGAVTGALLVVVVVDVLVAAAGLAWLDRTRTATSAGIEGVAGPDRRRPRLPRGRIVAVGLLVLAVYMLDSAVATWSTIYLQTGLAVLAAVAPLGYAAYQAAILLMRVVTDPLEARVGRMPLAAGALGAGVAGCLLVAIVPTAGGAIAGFTVAGLATGALVPLAFSSAGDIDPARSDEVIARVNLFNYAGAVAGAVVIGLVATGPSLGMAFVIPGVALLALGPLLRRVVGRKGVGAMPGLLPADQ